ncbi:sigma-70 family RNA polymerase sigma factor [Bacillus sp. JJ722]|uniref:sigma-70 family RNA polymerase sigma factor n=1 Tax=Bacillus sp. JJ722 TaxID=3122973 RepID=UPI002FFDEEC5
MSVEHFQEFMEENREEWLEIIMDQYGEKLTRLAFNYLKDWGMAQDVVQDVFVICYREFEKKEIEYFKSWIYRITINRCKDVLKSSFVKKILFNNALIKSMKSKDHTPEMELVVNDEKAILSQIVLSLPLKYREIIILYYYEELTVSEITSLLSINQNTVKTRLKRGRHLLKKLLESSDLVG